MFNYRIWFCWDLSRICLASSRKLGLMVFNRINTWKNSSNDESLELNIAISRINSQCMIFDKKMTVNENSENWQCVRSYYQIYILCLNCSWTFHKLFGIIINSLGVVGVRGRGEVKNQAGYKFDIWIQKVWF